MSFAFEDDTAVRAVGDGSYEGAVTDRWSIDGRPNGGYLMGIILNAMSAEAPGLTPLALTGHFLSPADPGPAHIHVDMIKRGRSISTATATLSQGARQRLVMLVSLGSLESQKGPTRSLASPPPLPDTLVSSAGRPAPHPIVDRFEFLLPPAQAQVAAGIVTPGETRAEFTGKIRFSDGYLPTATAVPLLVDAYPPAIFNLGLIGWTPTIELTIHQRGTPIGAWQVLRVSTRHLIDGLLEEEAELWNEDGSLVAQSRQLARVLA